MKKTRMVNYSTEIHEIFFAINGCLTAIYKNINRLENIYSKQIKIRTIKDNMQDIRVASIKNLEKDILKGLIDRRKNKMPLKKSKSKAAFKDNLKTELSAGKPKKQALAIAYAVKKKAKGKNK